MQSHLSLEINLQVGRVLILQFVLGLINLVRRAAAIAVFQLISPKMAPVQLQLPPVLSVVNRAITAMYAIRRHLKAGKLMLFRLAVASHIKGKENFIADALIRAPHRDPIPD